MATSTAPNKTSQRDTDRLHTALQELYSKHVKQVLNNWSFHENKSTHVTRAFNWRQNDYSACVPRLGFHKAGSEGGHEAVMGRSHTSPRSNRHNRKQRPGKDESAKGAPGQDLCLWKLGYTGRYQEETLMVHIPIHSHSE